MVHHIRRLDSLRYVSEHNVRKSTGTRNARIGRKTKVTAFDSGYAARPPFRGKLRNWQCKIQFFVFTKTRYLECQQTAAGRDIQRKRTRLIAKYQRCKSHFTGDSGRDRHSAPT